MISVLIVDDEKLARENVKALLNNQQDIGPIYEAVDGDEAVVLGHIHQPDIVFLDIQMPGLSGLEVAEHLPDKSVVVFATAYDQHAISAFELSAVDYLLKPFDNTRFYQALVKARTSLLAREFNQADRIKDLLVHYKADKSATFKTKLIIKEPGRIRFVEVRDINFIQAAGNYVEIHTLDGQSLLLRETLSRLEQELNPNKFVRIHRSTIICKASVCELKPSENGEYTVVLKSGEQLILSRRSKSKLEQLLSDDC